MRIRHWILGLLVTLLSIGGGLSGCALFGGQAGLDVEISASSSEGSIPLTVQLDARAPGAASPEFAWDIDNDGRTDARGARVQPTFKRVGTHTVRVAVRDDQGRSGGATVTVDARAANAPAVAVGGDVDPPAVPIEPQQTGAAKLSVEGADAGVGSVTVGSLRYDADVVGVERITGSGPFNVRDVAIDNDTGRASFTAEADNPPNGDSLVVAQILLRAETTSESESRLDLRIPELTDASGQPIPNFETVNGRVRVRPADAAAGE